MRLAVAITAVLLCGPGPVLLLAAEEPPRGVPDPSTAQRPESQVTIDRSNQLVGGVAFGGPLGIHATIGLLHGLGADVEEDAERVRAVCAAPIPHCAHGFLVEADAGSGGGKLSLGLGGRARVDNEDFRGAVGVDLKASLARTWGSPVGTEPDLTYLGPELDLEVKHVGASLGVLWRVSGHGGSSAVFSWGLGLRL
jgi:hypothetical protein